MAGPLETLKLAYAPWPIRPEAPASENEAKDEPIPDKPDANDQPGAAAYGAAVGHLINRPDTIRARAQVSATISAAIAAALAAFAPLSGLDAREDWLQLLVAAAIVSWLVSLWRYILVIGFSYQNDRDKIEQVAETLDTEKTDDKLKSHLYRFVGYATRMRLKVERGTAATQMAILLTLVAAVALAIEDAVAGEKPLVVSLTDEGLRAVDAVCDPAIDEHVMEVEARPDNLKLSVVPLKLPEGFCRRDAVVVHVRRGWIEATRTGRLERP